MSPPSSYSFNTHRYPITAGRPGSNYSLHQHSSLLSSSLLSLLAAKEGTNSLTLQQINDPLPPSCTVPVQCTDENQHQYCSSSEPSGSTLISVSRTKPPNGYSHSGYPSSAGPSPSLSPSSSSSQSSSNRSTVIQSKSTRLQTAFNRGCLSQPFRFGAVERWRSKGV